MENNIRINRTGEKASGLRRAFNFVMHPIAPVRATRELSRCLTDHITNYHMSANPDKLLYISYQRSGKVIYNFSDGSMNEISPDILNKKGVLGLLNRSNIGSVDIKPGTKSWDIWRVLRSQDGLPSACCL